MHNSMNLCYNGNVQERSGFLFCQQQTAIMCELAFPGQIGKSHDGGLLQGAKVKEIFLTQGMVAVVSDDWYDILNQRDWQFHNSKRQRTGYSTRVEGKRPHRKSIFMHNVIAKTPEGMECDHIDGNGLNNLPENLRNCTKSQNLANQPAYRNNTSGYKGVSWHKKMGKWMVQIQINSQKIHIGYFSTIDVAARAYDTAAIKYFGEFAWLNFPEEHRLPIG